VKQALRRLVLARQANTSGTKFRRLKPYSWIFALSCWRNVVFL